ncbi:MAG: alpha/beta hydrolase [Rikenellaceae bacterium]
MRKLIVLLVFCLVFLSAKAEILEEVFTYKNTGKRDLTITKLSSATTPKNAPAVVLFFGGGWHGGKLNQLRPHAEIYVEHGMVAFLVDYRVFSRDKTLPDKSIEDAKSAMRFVRGNAKKFKINPKKIVASGESAGGHLASATAFITEIDSAEDNLKISPVPNAMVLINPVSDTSPEGYHSGLVQNFGEWQRLSALHNIKKSSPPTIYFVGDRDKHVPVASAKAFKKAVEDAGARCDLLIYENCFHSDFNSYKRDGEYFKISMDESLKFLRELKFIK